MGVDATLGVKSASEFIFFILTLPSGGYFKGAGERAGRDRRARQPVGGAHRAGRRWAT